MIIVALDEPLEVSLVRLSYHTGSSAGIPTCSVSSLGPEVDHFTARAQILKAEAMGPNVPASKGKTVEANHQRLRKLD